MGAYALDDVHNENTITTLELTAASNARITVTSRIDASGRHEIPVLVTHGTGRGPEQRPYANPERW